jgi:ComF family protein
MIADRILSLVAPHDCLGCGREGTLACPVCLGHEARKRPTCFRCNRLSASGRTCPACRRHSQLAGVIVARRYEALTKELVWRLKYHHQVEAAGILAQMILPQIEVGQFDVVASIPGAPSRYRRRGYHQADLIAKEVARRSGLRRTTPLGRLETPSQVGSSRRFRLEGVKGSFITRRSSQIVGQRVLLIDDVLTTGATLSEAAAVLKSAGAKSVWGAVCAKHSQ